MVDGNWTGADVIFCRSDDGFKKKSIKVKMAATVSESGLKIAILGHARGLNAPWDPSTTQTGLPGSEESVVYGSQELVALGHTVTIYINPPPDSIWLTTNPKWIHVDQWHNPANTESYDLVLMWRRFDPKAGHARGKIVFHWPHDSPGYYGRPMSLRGFDGLLFLSTHHYNQYRGRVSIQGHSVPLFTDYESIPSIIAGNGALLEHFSSPMAVTNPYSIGYFSNYARGLVHLLELWPSIRRHVPTATLSICYGRDHWGTCPPPIFDFIITSIAKFKDEGVTEHGKVGHLELAQIMAQTSVWAYPCGHLGATETFCITAVKAQLAGMIPVTTRIGALNETVHPDAPSIPRITTRADIVAFGVLLLQTLDRIRTSKPDLIRSERLKYIAYGQQFSWQACVHKWLELYYRVTTN